jgi:hypothetical protein
MFLAKHLVRGFRVWAHPNDKHSFFLERFDPILERYGLLRSPARVVFSFPIFICVALLRPFDHQAIVPSNCARLWGDGKSRLGVQG